MKALKRNVGPIGFLNRENDSSGRLAKFRCGRDFLYYTLNYYYPEKFNPSNNNSFEIERQHMLGLRLPWWLMWTQLQFMYLPKLFSRLGLKLTINGAEINSFFLLLVSLSIPQKSNAEEKIKEIEKAIDSSHASGIDISLRLGGLIDHVLFVDGYDNENFYVLDTHQVPGLEYEKLTNDNKYYMRLSKHIVKKRWTRFGRV